MKFADLLTRVQTGVAGVATRSSAMAGVLLLASTLYGQSGPWLNGSNGAIYYNGSVGIGTSVPAAGLDIAGTAVTAGGAGASLFNVGRYPTVGFNDYTGSYLAGTTGFGGLWQLDSATGDMTYWSGSNVGAGAAHTHASVLAIKQNGNVGVGTLNPTDKFEAVGVNGSYIKSTAPQIGTNNWAG